MVPVAQPEFAGRGVEVQLDLAGLEHLAEVVAEHRQQHAPVHLGLRRLPLDVEGVRVRRRAPVFQHVEPPGVVGLQHAHVVRHDVEDLAHAVAPQRLAHARVGEFVAHLGIELRVVDDVVAVGAARSCPQVGRAVQVAHAERAQVRDRAGDLLEGAALVELHAVGAAGHVRGVERRQLQRPALQRPRAAALGAQDGRERRPARIAAQRFDADRQLAAPVREAVLGRARHVHLQQLPGDVFQLHAHQPARRAGEIGVHRIDQRLRRVRQRRRLHARALGQQLFALQREQQVGAVLRPLQDLLFARRSIGIEPELRAQLDVLAEPEAAQRGQVVRADHRQRLGLPLRGPAKAPVFLALEQQRLVRQQVALAHGLAHAGRYVAQVLADHHAFVAQALQRQHAHQVVERVLHVGAAVRPGPEQAHERHHVVEPQCARMTHVGAQRVDEGLVARLPQALRAPGRQPPVLPAGGERIGRGAGVHAQRVHPMLDPGLGAAAVDAHGEVAIQPDAHAARARIALARLELQFRQPLQPEAELHLRRVFAPERPHRVAFRVAVFRGPGRPAPYIGVGRVQVVVQRFEQGVAPGAVLALAHVGEEVRAARVVLVQLVPFEMAPQQRQHFVLGGGDAFVVDHLAVAQAAQAVLERLRLHLLHRLVAAAQVDQRLHVEIQGVERLAARRAVRARGGGVVREERVQRAQADERCTLMRRQVAQPAQVAEIADAPVARGAQRIELDRAAPPALALPERGRDVALARRDRHAAELVRRCAFEREPVVAGGEGLRQGDGRRLEAALHVAARELQRVVLAREAPAQRRVFVAGPAQHAGVAFAQHAHGGQAMLLDRDGTAVAGHGGQRAREHRVGNDFFLAPEPVVAIGHAEAACLLRERQVGEVAHSVISSPKVQRADHAGQVCGGVPGGRRWLNTSCACTGPRCCASTVRGSRPRLSSRHSMVPSS